MHEQQLGAFPPCFSMPILSMCTPRCISMGPHPTVSEHSTLLAPYATPTNPSPLEASSSRLATAGCSLAALAMALFSSGRTPLQEGPSELPILHPGPPNLVGLLSIDRSPNATVSPTLSP